MKKVWEKPRLIVLVRSRPGEAVLTLCKGNLLLPADSAGCDCDVEAETCAVCSANRIS
jgi:hypothetical protein